MPGRKAKSATRCRNGLRKQTAGLSKRRSCFGDLKTRPRLAVCYGLAALGSWDKDGCTGVRVPIGDIVQVDFSASVSSAQSVVNILAGARKVRSENADDRSSGLASFPAEAYLKNLRHIYQN
jgi:hypothetical protein